MTIDDIKSIIKSDETRTLELKKTTGELKDGMHSACAFLNTDGGWLIIGVTPTSLKILGQQVTDNTRREIAGALTSLEPAVDIRVEYIDVPEHPGNQIIAMYFEPWVWGHTPYTCNGRPYYKVESTTKVMPRDMFEERLRHSKPQYFAWERQEADGITIADLDEDRIRGAVRLGIEGGRLNEAAMTEPIETLLQKSELLNDGKLNNAAVMLFSKKHYGYPQLRLRMARFRGTGKNEFGDNQQTEGNFFDLLDAGMSFLFKHLNLSGKIVGLRRMEQLEIPVEALRETLVNSLCHRRYDQPGTSVGIAVYDDRVEIENPGILPPELTPETIKQPHNSHPYNPLIATFLYRTTFLESWGSGVRRIIESCAAAGVEEPIWHTNPNFVWVTFIRPADKSSYTQTVVETTTTQKESILGGSSAEKDLTTTLKGGSSQKGTSSKMGTSSKKGTSFQKDTSSEKGTSSKLISRIIDVLNFEYRSLHEIMDALGLKNRAKFSQNYIVPALNAGIIERKYPEQPNHPNQRYRLTEKAMHIKYSQEEK